MSASLQQQREEFEQQANDGLNPVELTRHEIKQLNDKIGSLMTQAENIRMKYQGKKEEMSGQEETEFVRLVEEANTLTGKVELGMKWLKVKQFTDNLKANAGNLPMGGSVATSDLSQKHLAAYRAYLRGQDKANLHRLERFYNDEYLPTTKAYQSDNPAGGGFAVLPQQLIPEFLTLVKDIVFVRDAATVYSVPNAESLGVPAIDVDPSDDDWTSELGVGNPETNLSVGKRELKPAPLAKRIVLSKKLLRQVPNIENVIMDRMAYKVGITMEKAYISGSGANEPLGVYVASPNGISTNRDTVAASSTAIGADDILNLFYSLKAQYMARCSWLLARSIVLALRKLKDANNNYLWTAGYGRETGTVTGPGGGLAGTPDTLMGRPVWMSEYAPSTLTTGLYTMVVGDFSRYWIADSLELTIQTLYELYAGNNQMGYILRIESDGMPVLEEAFARLRQL